MPISGADIAHLTNPFHAYVFGTSFWYFLRAFCRITSPLTVIDWFRPPIQEDQIPTDLEIYTIWTDGWQLLALSLILLLISDAVPLPKGLSAGSSLNNSHSGVSIPAEYKKPYARGIIAVTILHHITTGYGAWHHWSKPTHHTIAMDIGVYGNIALTAFGILALTVGPLAGDSNAARKKKV